MLGIRRNPAARALAIIVAVATYISPGSLWAGKRYAQQVDPRLTILVFPLDTSRVEAPANFGKDLAEAIKSTFSMHADYMCLTFSQRLSPVARGLQEGSLRATDIAGPFSAENSSAGEIAGKVRADVYLVGEVDEIRVDVADQFAEMTLSVQLVDVETDDTLMAVLVTGRSPEGVAANTRTELLSLAAGNAVAVLMAELMPETPIIEMAEPAPVRKIAGKLRLPLRQRESPIAVATKPIALVFPFDSDVPGVSEELGAELAEWLKTSLNLSDGYMAVDFSERLPPVVRMLEEGGLRASDVAGPFAKAESAAAKIAGAVGSDIYVVGTIEDINVNPQANKAEMMVGIQVLDTASGRNLKTLAVSGKSPEDNGSISERDLVTLAGADAIANAVRDIVPQAPALRMANGTPTQAKKRSNIWRTLLIGLAVAGGLAIIREVTGDKDDPHDTNGPPPPPGW